MWGGGVGGSKGKGAGGEGGRGGQTCGLTASRSAFSFFFEGFSRRPVHKKEAWVASEQSRL